MIQHTKKAAKEQGFTLVELLLATSFIAFIMLFLVFAVLQVMGNYNKGLAVKEINQTTRTIVEEVGRLVRTSSASGIKAGSLGAGRLCIGDVSYVWNMAGMGTVNKMDDNSAINFVRAEDSGGTLCIQSGGTYPNVPKQKARALSTDQIVVQYFNLGLVNGVASIDLVLSTSGDNAPAATEPPQDRTCGGGREAQYCAVARFSTKVMVRNGGN